MEEEVAAVFSSPSQQLFFRWADRTLTVLHTAKLTTQSFNGLYDGLQYRSKIKANPSRKIISKGGPQWPKDARLKMEADREA